MDLVPAYALREQHNNPRALAGLRFVGHRENESYFETDLDGELNGACGLEPELTVYSWLIRQFPLLTQDRFASLARSTTRTANLSFVSGPPSASSIQALIKVCRVVVSRVVIKHPHLHSILGRIHRVRHIHDQAPLLCRQGMLTIQLWKESGEVCHVLRLLVMPADIENGSIREIAES